MIKTETKTIDGNEFDYTYSTIRMMIQNESGQQFEEAYDVKGHNHTYTETDIPIVDPDIPEEDQKTWEQFLKEYEFFFGDKEYIYSKYKAVKACIEADIWNQIKNMMNNQEYVKDLYDAATEFSSKDDIFMKGVFAAYSKLNMNLHDIYELLYNCQK